MSDNRDIVKDFLNKWGVSENILFPLEIYGQVSDGELENGLPSWEDDGMYEVDYKAFRDLVGIKESDFENYEEIRKDWINVRDSLDFNKNNFIKSLVSNSLWDLIERVLIKVSHRYYESNKKLKELIVTQESIIKNLKEENLLLKNLIK